MSAKLSKLNDIGGGSFSISPELLRLSKRIVVVLQRDGKWPQTIVLILHLKSRAMEYELPSVTADTWVRLNQTLRNLSETLRVPYELHVV